MKIFLMAILLAGCALAAPHRKETTRKPMAELQFKLIKKSFEGLEKKHALPEKLRPEEKQESAATDERAALPESV